MKVAMVVGGRYFAFDIARELQARGALGGVASSYALAPREGIARRLLRWNPAPDLLRRAESRIFSTPDTTLDLRSATRFGRWAARHVPPGDVVHAWTGSALETLAVARGRGSLAVAVRASAHVRSQAAILGDEFARFGWDAPTVDPAMVERECAEYARADAVHVFSTFALHTFLEQGFSAERLVMTPIGVDPGEVAARGGPPPPRPGPLRVLALGHVGVRKGTHYLLRAIRMLSTRAVEVSLVGGLAPEGGEILRRYGRSGEWRGGVPRSALRRVFAEHDVLVLASVEDGFGAVICEAMAAGLPVVATRNTGAPDVVREGETGLLVPAGSAEALAAALDALAADRERCRAMGRAAAEAMRSQRSWGHMVDDMLAAYGALAGRPEEAECAS
ncbi:MAG TPA: glycosyltransferase family 4 protein [Longimicrobiaceae bacterium]|nr:glycosyltransferase family 4 protein [Longimicrobiaceae bacterium]